MTSKFALGLIIGMIVTWFYFKDKTSFEGRSPEEWHRAYRNSEEDIIGLMSCLENIPSSQVNQFALPINYLLGSSLIEKLDVRSCENKYKYK